MPIINGTAGADDLVGTDAAETINGLDGNDRITGGLGADTLNGDSGDDTFWFNSVGTTTDTLPWGAINGGDGFDTVDLSNVQPTSLDVAYESGEVSVGVGSQSYAVTGIERLIFGDGADSVRIQGAAEPGMDIWAGGGNDFIFGDSTNSLFGEAGDDVFLVAGLFPGSGGEIDGGAGTDVLQVASRFYSVDLQSGVVTYSGGSFEVRNIEHVTVYLWGAGANVIGNALDNVFSVTDDSGVGGLSVSFEGGGGNDNLTGSTGGDTLGGGSGNDVIDGASGDDRLVGGIGDDHINGGSGTDTAYFASATSGVTVRLDLSTAQNTGGAGSDTISAVENLAGSRFADNLSGDTSNNELAGLNGDDQLFGGAGDDTLDGGAGVDRLHGGTGNDIYAIRDSSDYVYENAGEGTDRVISSISYILRANVEQLSLTGTANLSGRGNAEANVISGNSGANRLDGYDGNDRLYGGAGNDVLNGGSGDDGMRGDAGNDIYFVDSSRDVVVEALNGGTDTVYSSATLTLRANVERLTLTGADALRGTGNELANNIIGNAGANTISGMGGNDRLFGNDGADTLVGGDGYDLLDGGAARDRLTGGSGIDFFIFDDGDFGGTTAATADQIIDFSQAERDRIDLRGVDSDAAVAGDQAFAFIGTAAFSGTAGELRYEQIGSGTFVQGDIDGDGAADFVIRIEGLHPLGVGDFVL